MPPGLPPGECPFYYSIPLPRFIDAWQPLMEQTPCSPLRDGDEDPDQVEHLSYQTAHLDEVLRKRFPEAFMAGPGSYLLSFRHESGVLYRVLICNWITVRGMLAESPETFLSVAMSPDPVIRDEDAPSFQQLSQEWNLIHRMPRAVVGRIEPGGTGHVRLLMDVHVDLGWGIWPGFLERSIEEAIVSFDQCLSWFTERRRALKNDNACR